MQLIAETAREYDCAIRVGVNCGSVDPIQKAKYDPTLRKAKYLKEKEAKAAMKEKIRKEL